MSGVAVFRVVEHSGRILSTRPKGKAAAGELATFARRVHPLMVEVSFEGCEVASPPFMQELLRACKRLGDRVIYSCLNDDVHATLTYVEARLALRGVSPSGKERP